MDLKRVNDEREKVFAEMIKYDPTSVEYEKLLMRFNELTTFLRGEADRDLDSEKEKRDIELKEKKMQVDLEVARQSSEAKNKESKRGLIKTIITVVGSILGTVLVIFGEEFKLIGNKAWSTLSRYPKG